MASSLDAYRRGNDAFVTSSALLLNHLAFRAPVLEDDLGMATCPDVGVVKAHVAAGVVYSMAIQSGLGVNGEVGK